jgi:integrase
VEGSVFRRCGCRDPKSGRQLGTQCPKLSRRDHGSWWARHDAPTATGGGRQQPRIGPYKTKKEAEAKLIATINKINTGEYLPVDKSLTIAVDLRRWLAGRIGLKASTQRCNEELAELYLVPGLGHLRPTELREHHIEELYRAMRQIGRPSEEPPTPMLRRLLDARTDTQQARRPLGRARIRRTHAVLHAYLNAAVRRRTIPRNPVSNVELASARSAKALAWTPERVNRWRQTGRRPSRCMVWTPEQAGAFLDHATADRLYPLFHVVGYRGLRRSEALGLPWTDLDLDIGTLTIRETLVDLDTLDPDYEEFDDPKTIASERTVTLDADTVAVLRTWRRQQAKERLAAGPTWVDSGRVFTTPTGAPLNPKTVSQHFNRLLARTSQSSATCTATTRAGSQCQRHGIVHIDGQPRCGLRRHGGHIGERMPATRSGLPPIRFHDLRHTAASLTYRATNDLKLVSELLGHSSIKMTADIYTNIYADVDRAAAEAVARLVPRATDPAQRTTTAPPT